MGGSNFSIVIVAAYLKYLGMKCLVVIVVLGCVCVREEKSLVWEGIV